MSVSEILAQLPQLEAAELELVCQRVFEIQQRYVLDPSPALLQAIDEADAATDEDGLTIEQMQDAARSWNTK